MKRRNFIKLIGSGALIFPIAPLVSAQHISQSLDLKNWTSYRLTYQVDLPTSGSTARLWLPLPDTNDSAFQFTQGSNWSGNATKASFSTIGASSFPVFTAEWQGKQKDDQRHVTVSCIVKTSDHSVNLSEHPVSTRSIPNNVKNYLASSHLKPINGIVRETAISIIKENNAATTLEQARAIYDWVIDNTRYDEEIRGRGKGDVKSMFEKNTLTGKCVDINSLFVNLARAANIPARNQYGIRMNESKLHQSIGKYGDISQSQHCRPEFYLAGSGWIPVNPADVKQVSALEDIPLDEQKMILLREKFFGTWEMNWVTFNHAEDLLLASNSIAGKLPFFMFPHAEIDGKILDSLDSENFSYKITSSELIGTGAKF